MNPQSAYYLSFNIGYPNAFDKALGRTGSQLMVHGDCSSRGCYAMTDEQIAEIYSLGRESFFGGQRAFQVQAYPFKMTPVNMAKHRNNPNMPFWKMIKEGYDHFEVTRQEPKVEFCENKYVFDPAQPPNSSKPLVFNASAKCPAYVIPDEIADAVREKQQQDAAETAKLISKGTPVARLNTGIDGGMNKVFAAKLPGAETGLSEGGEGQSLSLLALSRAPGTIPSHVNPPRNPLLASQEEPVVAVTPAAAPATRVASAAPESQVRSGFFSNLARKVGLTRRHHLDRGPGQAESHRGQRHATAFRCRAQDRRRSETGGHQGRRRRAAAVQADGFRSGGCAPGKGCPGRGRTADRAGEFVREPLLGGEVSGTSEGWSKASCAGPPILTRHIHASS